MLPLKTGTDCTVYGQIDFRECLHIIVLDQTGTGTHIYIYATQTVPLSTGVLLELVPFRFLLFFQGDEICLLKVKRETGTQRYEKVVYMYSYNTQSHTKNKVRLKPWILSIS